MVNYWFHISHSHIIKVRNSAHISKLFRNYFYTIGKPADELVVERVDTETANASIDEPLAGLIVADHPLE